MRLATIMTKSSDFIASFQGLNDQIVAAISAGSYERVIILDKARQVLLQDLCLTSAKDVDDELFDFIESCAQQNTKMIENMELKLEQLTFHNNRFKKAVKAYHN